MNVREEEYTLLLKQRDQLMASIQQTTKSFHTTVFSTLTALSAALALMFRLNQSLPPWYLFLIIQLLLGIFFFVIGLLFCMNNDRDYIRAIDTYLKEEYEIKILFYQGELSYQHINHMSSPFSKLTSAGAIIIGLLVLGILTIRWKEIVEISALYPVYTVLVVVELLIAAAFVINNIHYKLTSKSKFYSETLAFLRNSHSVSPMHKKNEQGKK